MTSMTPIDSYRKIEAVPITSSSPAAAINKNKALLIEGKDSAQLIKYPEINLAIKVIGKNQIKYFDCIQSFNTSHLIRFFESQSLRDHKKIAICIIERLSLEAPVSEIIEEKIKPVLKELVSKGIYREMPEWVAALKTDFAHSLQELKDSYSNEQEREKDTELLHSSMIDLSNQISAESFFAYLQNHPEIDEIYGMIHLNHLGFLDKYAQKVTYLPKESHLEIVDSNRTIAVHLFGGIYGDIGRFDAMASFVSQEGLIVPKRDLQQAEQKFDYWMKNYNHPENMTPAEGLLDWVAVAGKELVTDYEEFTELTKRLSQMGYEIGEVSSEQFDAAKRGEVFLTIQERLQRAEQKFDYWMKNYNHLGNMTHAEELLQWLYQDSGGKLIENYDEFTELAKRLNQMGYEIEEVPAQEQFDMAMKKYGSAYQSYQKELESERSEEQFAAAKRGEVFSTIQETPKLSADERLQRAEQKFDYWMKNYNHRGNRAHAEKLLQWLYQDFGGKLIKNYDEFTELAKRLNQMGYEIEEMPSLEQFDKAMKNFEELNTPVSPMEITTPKPSPQSAEERLQRAEQNFDYWMKNYNHLGNMTHAEELLQWLYQNSGGKLIENYDEFTELAKRLSQMGYEIEEVPSQEQFAAAKRGEVFLTIQERLQRAEQKFDYWMKNYNHLGNRTHAEKLLDWLYCDGGGKLIENYDEFTELAKRLNQMGYEIEEVSSQEQFDVAKKEFLERMR